MVCYSPLKGYQSRERSATGKRKFVMSHKLGFIDMPMTVPCGGCIGCRIDRSRQWAIRCEHEISLHRFNCFITLTYNSAHLPKDGSLNVKHFQDFMKRFRRRVTNPSDKYFVSTDFKLRFFHCGEYGERLGRPHYHALIFGYDFPDKVFLQKGPSGCPLFRSNFLEELWPYGFSSIGEANWQSAAYVARYIMKKVTGDAADDHYRGRKPEYVTMSRKPGIASDWFDKFFTDVYPRGEVVMKGGMKMKPPKFYDVRYEIIDPEDLKRIKMKRKIEAELRSSDNTPERLQVKRKVVIAKLSSLKRDLE